MFNQLDISKNKLIDHEKYLRNNIFFTEKKWPHFNLIFKDIKKLSSKMPSSSKILFIERTNLYGGLSLFAPFFYKHKICSIDCSEKFIKSRGHYNKSLINIDKLIPFYSSKQISYNRTKFLKEKADLIIIPNLIHHIPYHYSFLKNLKKNLNTNGKIYIFEPLIRELHQIPNDYLRYTPYGLERLFIDLNFKNVSHNLEGGPFSVISYCYDQALQYLPKKINKKEKLFFEKTLLPKLDKFENKYKKNLIREHSTFPMSYSVLATK